MAEVAADALMGGEMDEQMDDMEGQDPEENGMDDDDGDEDGEGEKNEYKKKELVAKPWHSEYVEQTTKEVEEFAIKNQR